MARETCEICRYYKSRDERGGECRRYPPTFTTLPDIELERPVEEKPGALRRLSRWIGFTEGPEKEPVPLHIGREVLYPPVLGDLDYCGEIRSRKVIHSSRFSKKKKQKKLTAM